MKLKPPREQDILKQCLEYLRLRGIFAWRQNSGAFAGEHQGRKRFVKFCGAEGCSDILGILPTGRFLAVECKRPGEKPTEKQMAFLVRVSDFGGLSGWVTSVKDLELLLGNEG